MLFVALLTLVIVVTAGIVVAQEPEPTPQPQPKPFIDATTVATLAVLLGAICRILWPYWRKITDATTEQKPAFDYKFLVTGIEAMVEGAIVAGQILPGFLTAVTEPVGSLLLLFVLGFNYGWARTDINNRLVT